MRIVETKCYNCKKKMLVYDQYIKEKMFCTLRCMDTYITNNGENPKNK